MFVYFSKRNPDLKFSNKDFAPTEQGFSNRKHLGSKSMAKIFSLPRPVHLTFADPADRDHFRSFLKLQDPKLPSSHHLQTSSEAPVYVR